MKFWPLIGLLLIGCDRKNSVIPGVSVNSSQTMQAPRNVMFVVWGQSNMVGAGEPSTPAYQDNLKYYDGYARSGLIRYFEDGHYDNSQYPAFKWTGYQHGPAYRFAQDWLRQYPNDTLYVVNCAESGTSIAEWQPGTPLFERCVHYVEDAKTPTIPNLIMGPMLVMQGEEDGTGTTQDWASQFENTATSLRSIVGSQTVIFGQIGANALGAANWSSIQAQQASVSIPNVYMVRTSDLPYGMTVHFTADGYQGIANRMFDMWRDHS